MPEFGLALRPHNERRALGPLSLPLNGDSAKANGKSDQLLSNPVPCRQRLLVIQTKGKIDTVLLKHSASSKSVN